MTNFFASYPPAVGGGGVSTYANLAAFPSAASAGNGALAIALDTDTLYISNGSAWLVISGPGVALSVGTFDSGVASANGAHIDGNAIIMQSATATVPGSLNTSTQTIAGVKTFNSAPTLASLSASLPLQLDGSKNVTSAAINLSGSQATGTLAAARFPALTADVTTTAGSLATSLVATTNATLTTLSALTTASSLASIGTITSGTWAGTTIAINHGGTNSTTALNNNRVMVSSGGAIVEEAAITGNKALASNSSGLPVASAVTDTELGYVSGVTSSIQTQLNARSVPQTPSVNQYYYVSSQGNDTSGDGTYNLPFATIAKAMGLILDAGASKRYIIKLIGSKIQEPTDVNLKPYVYIVGDSQDGTYLRINGGAGNIIPDSSWTTVGGARTGVESIYLGGGSGINWDLFAIGPSIGTPSCNLTLNNMTITGNLIFKGRVPDIDFGIFQLVYVIGSTTVDAGNVSGISTTFQGNATLSSTNGASNSLFTASAFLANLTITASSTFANIEQLNASSIGGTLTLTDSASHIQLITDSASYPKHSSISTTGSPVITLLSDAYGTLYTPTTSGNWNSIPTVLQSSLDTLATSGVVKSQTQNLVLASPNGSSGVPSFRALVSGDLPAGTGTVTSVAVSGGTTGLTTSGGPITTSGTITLAGTLAVANGGTGVTSSTGSGSNVLSNTPTLVTPVIGAATGTSLSVSGQLTSTVATGTAPLAITSTTRVANLNVATAGNADTVTTNANLTGVITSVGNATSIASQTGTGTKFVVDTSPTLVTPTIGAAVATSVTLVKAAFGTSSVKTVSSTTYTITDTDGYDTILVTTGASDQTITLPAVANNPGRSITFKKVDSGAGNVVIDTPGSETIDGAAQNRIVAQYSRLTIKSDGTNWYVTEVSDYVSTFANATAVTSTTAKSITTALTIPEGKWLLSTIGYLSGTATGISDFNTSISATNNTLPAGGTLADQRAATSGTFATTLTISDFLVTLTSATTYYNVSVATFIGGTGAISARLTGKRIL